jgi:hypothetical protein
VKIDILSCKVGLLGILDLTAIKIKFARQLFVQTSSAKSHRYPISNFGDDTWWQTWLFYLCLRAENTSWIKTVEKLYNYKSHPAFIVSSYSASSRDKASQGQTQRHLELHVHCCAFSKQWNRFFNTALEMGSSFSATPAPQHLHFSNCSTVIVAVVWEFVSVELRPLTGPLSIPQMIHEWIRSSGGMILTGENRRTLRKTCNNDENSIQLFILTCQLNRYRNQLQSQYKKIKQIQRTKNDNKQVKTQPN